MLLIIIKSIINFFMHYGDLTDSLSLTKIIQKVKPDEITI